jgi:hypothetical protein
MSARNEPTQDAAHNNYHRLYNQADKAYILLMFIRVPSAVILTL